MTNVTELLNRCRDDAHTLASEIAGTPEVATERLRDYLHLRDTIHRCRRLENALRQLSIPLQGRFPSPGSLPAY